MGNRVPKGWEEPERSVQGQSGGTAGTKGQDIYERHTIREKDSVLYAGPLGIPQALSFTTVLEGFVIWLLVTAKRRFTSSLSVDAQLRE